MKRRCSLCEGKLNGNICTECGLDNSKNDDQYVTLGKACKEEPMTHVHTEEEKPYEGKTMTRENVRKAKKAVKQAGKKKANTAAFNETYTYSAASTVNKPKKKRQILKPVIAIAVIAVFAGEFASTIKDEIWDSVNDSDYDYSSDSYDDPYSEITEEMPETGEAYEVDLTAGIYKGAVHLPQGSYTLTCSEGSGSVELIDNKNNIWVQYYFGDEYEDSENEINDFEVFPGCYVVINETLKLHMTTENAQMDMKNAENPLKESRTVSEKFTVGKEVPAGVYDVRCTKGLGIFDYNIDTPNSDEYYMGMLIGDSESGFPQELKNIVLTDGTEVELEGLDVELTPSKEIESEDYESFYDNYY